MAAAGGRVELNRTLDLLDVPPEQPPFRGSAGAAVFEFGGSGASVSLV